MIEVKLDLYDLSVAAARREAKRAAVDDPIPGPTWTIGADGWAPQPTIPAGGPLARHLANQRAINAYLLVALGRADVVETPWAFWLGADA